MAKPGQHPNSLKNLKPFKPGQSGNPGGKPKNSFSTLVNRELEKRSKKDPELTKLEELARDYVDQLLAATIRERRDYLARVWPEVKQTQVTGVESAEVRFSWVGEESPPDESTSDDSTEE